MSGGFFRGTSADQDTRFSNKQAKLMKSQKFAPELDHLVDTRKVKMDVIRPWIASRVTELIGFEDEVVINFIYGLLDGKEVNGKEVQISITGFMEKNTMKFMKELWTLLLSAQKNESGVPQQFLDAKEEETRKKQAEMDRIANEIQKRKEKESREFERERSKKMDVEVETKANNAMEPSSKHMPSKGSGDDAEDEKETDTRNGIIGRNSERQKSKSVSRSPGARRQPSISSDRVHQSPRRRPSVTPLRRRSPRDSLSPPRRRSSYSRHRSRSPLRHRSPSPMRHRLRSPIQGRSPSPLSDESLSPVRHRRSPPPVRRRRSPSPIRRRRSPSPIRRRRSPSPLRRRRSPSPLRRRRSPSPVRRRRSPSPVRRRRSPSPVRRRRSPSPVRRRRSPSPVRRRRSPSPVRRRRSRSPVHRRSPSPLHQRSPSPVRQRSPSPIDRTSPSPIGQRNQRSPSTPHSRSPCPIQHRSPIISCKRRSPSPYGSSSSSPVRRRSPSPVRSPIEHKRSSMRSPKERVRSRQKSPVLHRSSSSLRPSQRDQKDLRNKLSALSPSPGRPPLRSVSPPCARNRSASQDGRSPSPYESPDRQRKERITHGGSSSPHKSRDRKSHHHSPETSKEHEETENARESGDYNTRSSQKWRMHSSAIDKWNDSPVKGHYKVERSPNRLASFQTTDSPSPPNIMDSRRKDQEIKIGKFSGKGVDHETLDARKLTTMHKDNEKTRSGSNNFKDSDRSRKSEPVPVLPEKVHHNNGIGTVDSEESDKHRAENREKSKHKRSHRDEVASDDDGSYESEIEERKEAKRRRKEEKKLRKEEKRRRREERRRRREERRAAKLKLKDQDDASSSDDERGGRKASHPSDGEDMESDQRKLEIELRNKALESLKAKKGISH